MSITLIALHGFTQNGRQMRVGFAPIAERLPQSVTLECPTGSFECSEKTVERLRTMGSGEPWPPPHRGWFDASDDGRVYHHFDAALATIEEIMKRSVEAKASVGILGFSQGAIFGAALAALSACGKLPPLQFVVLVAGRIPRAEDLLPHFEAPIAIPSLHVWGERDKLSIPTAAQLAEKFKAGTRETHVWPGPHVIPSRGPGADAIVSFISRFA